MPSRTDCRPGAVGSAERDLRSLRMRRHRLRWWTSEQLEALLSACRDDAGRRHQGGDPARSSGVRQYCDDAGARRRAALRSAHPRVGEHRRAPPGRARTCPSTGCPFCVGGLEAPDPYDVRWFPNRWPAFAPGRPVDFVGGRRRGNHDAFPRSARARSCCSRPTTTSRCRRCRSRRSARSSTSGRSARVELLARPEVEYVLVFENRGREVGATIDHPHGQIYGYPFVPPAPAREAAVARAARLRRLRGGRSRARGRARASSTTRGDWVAWVPYASGYAYGMRIAPRAHIGSIAALDDTSPRRPRRAARRRARSLRPARGPRPIRATGSRTCCGSTRRRPRGGDEWHLHAHVAPPLRAPGVAALRRVGRARQRHAVEPGRSRSRRAGAPRRVSTRAHVPRARAGQPDRRPGRLPRGLGRLAGDRPRRASSTRPRATTGGSSARSSEFDGRRSTSPPTAATTRPRRDRSGAAPSRASRACSPSSGARRSAPTSTISSTVPVGAGLSSSAAFEVACALALADAAGFALAGTDLALAAQRAEHVATGVPCGIQDQMASVLGRADHARLPRLPHARRRAPRRSPRSCACSSCTPACPARSKARRTRSGAAESEAVARQPRAAGARATRRFEQVRDIPRGRHAVTEMSACASSRAALRDARSRRARSADAREPRVVARRHGGVDPRARHARRVPRRRGRVRRPPHGRGLRRLRRRDRPGRRIAGPIAARARPSATARAPGREPTAWVVRGADGAAPESAADDSARRDSSCQSRAGPRQPDR